MTDLLCDGSISAYVEIAKKIYKFHEFFNFFALCFTANRLSNLVNESLSLSEQDQILAGSEVTPETSSGMAADSSSSVSVPKSSSSSTSSSAQDVKGDTRLALLGPSTQKLVSISNNMNRHLTTLLVSEIDI